MFPEFSREQQKLNLEIQQFFEKLKEKTDTSIFGIGMVADNDAQTTFIKLRNPVIETPEHRIVILGTVYAVSLLECKKAVQSRYTTPGVNRFPKIVEDMLRTGGSSELGRIGRIDDEVMRAIRTEVRTLQRIYVGGEKSERIAFLTSVDPILSISEYAIDGRHTSGVPLKSQLIPLIIKAERAEMAFTSTAGMKVSDLRVEQRGVIDLIGPKFEIKGVQDNIIITKSVGRERIGDFITIIAIINLGIGAVLSLLRRGRFLEISLPLLFSAAVLLWLRYFSEWGKEYFAPSEIGIEGEAPMEMRFIGELA